MCYSDFTPVNRSCYTIKNLLGTNMYTLGDMCLQGTKMDPLGTKVYLLKR